MKSIDQKGMTLIELTVVLLILIALAGLALPYVGGTSSKALCDATDISMANIKKVIMDRYYLDTLGNFPEDKGSADYSLHYLFSKGNGTGDWNDFDPDSQMGWRGPYLQGSVTLDSNDLSQLDSSFKDESSSNNHVNRNLDDNDDDHADFAVLDAWGRPIVLQVTDCNDWDISTVSGKCARLISAGPYGGLGIGNAAIDTQILDDPTATTPEIFEQHRQNDDRILYLNAPTPADDINISCGDY